jgi:choline transporter-like protein 2/4/5
MNRCIPWLDYSVMLTMFCGASSTATGDSGCPTDDLSEEFSGIAAFFEEAIADIATAWYVIAASAGIALVIGFMYLFFMEKCATCVVMCGLFGTILGTAAMTFAFYVEYDHLKDRVDTTPQLATHEEDERNMYICMAFAIIFAIACAIVTCVVICFCKQVCVAAKLLECGADAIMDMPMLIFYPLGNIFNLLCFFAMFVAGSLFIASAGTITYNGTYGYAEVEFDDTLQGAFVYWLFGFLWIAEFASAVGFMVVAFCFAMWFFAPKRGGATARTTERVMEGWPICTAIRLTMCHHLGTCAAGSLIIAIIQMLRIMLEYLDTKKKEIEEAGVVPCMCLWDFVFCCCRCCLWCMEKCMKYINKVAYIFTVIKGEWFCSAACSAVTTLINEFSWVAIVTSITSCMLFFGKLMTSLIVAAICGYWTSTLDVSSILFPTFFTFIIAFAIAMLFAEVYEMAIDTMLICYLHAKNRGLLEATGPGSVPPEFLKICNKEEEKMRNSIKLRESRLSEKDLAQAQPMEGDHGKSNVE